MRVLLIDDNQALAQSLGDYLEELGYEMDFAYSGRGGLGLLETNAYDVIVLDVSMPGLDGLQTCTLIRETLHNPVPIIFLTARDTLEDKIAGFEAGADDYLVKPFAPEELHYRLRAVGARGQRADIGRHRLGGLLIDHSKGVVHREGRTIRLNATQMIILKTLAQHAPNPVSRETLSRAMWQNGTPDSEPLRTHIYRLRAALDKPFEKAMIDTVYGIGYRLVCDP